MSGLPWYRGQMLALDLETTGINAHEDRIVTASMVFVPAALRPQTATWYVDPYRKGGRKLNQLAAHYGVLLGDAHQAYADALASCRILTRLAEKYAHIGKSNPHELHDLQVDWRREQMDGLRKYFDRKGTQHDGCCGEWPIHTACAPVAQEALL